MDAYVFSSDSDYRRMLHLELTPLFEQVTDLAPSDPPPLQALCVLDIDGMKPTALERFLASDNRLYLLSKQDFPPDHASRAVCFSRPFLMREFIASLAAETVEKHPKAPQDLPNLGGAFLDYDRKNDRFLLNETPLALSEKEKKLLLLLYENRGRVVTTDAIFRQIGDRSDPEGNSVAVYISFLRKKLSKPDAPGVIIRTVRGIGYLLV